jgi:hypothetical protein
MGEDGFVWRQLSRIDHGQLTEARLQAHYAAQWLARAARAYIPPQPNDGHTSLHWDSGFDGFRTQSLNGTQLSLQITSLTLGFHKGGSAERLESLSLTGLSDTQVRQWLGEKLGERSLDAQRLDVPSPYEMPANDIGQGATYDAVTLAVALSELAAWFANAQFLLDYVQKQSIGPKISASAVCCWPHHFDLATLSTLPTRDPGIIGYVGAGLSPGDGYYDEPYFYVSVYPKPDSTALPSLPNLGHWHTHEFTAAVAPARTILIAKNQKTETLDYLQIAVAHAVKLLS